MKIEADDILHYGILRRSGRYPWGSTNNVVSRSMSFLDYVEEMKRKGLSEKEIADGVGLTINQLRDTKTIARAQKKTSDIITAQRLRDKGWSNVAIGQRMGIGESSVRALLAPGAADKANILTSTADMLRTQIAEKGVIDVGKGVEHWLGISAEKLKAAVSMLRDEGYEYHKVRVPQQIPGQFTENKVLAKKGITQKEIFLNPSMIKQISEHSEDGGRTFFGIFPPLPISPKRVAVNYKEDGGAEADGVIYVRPGVKDTDLGNSRYAQVRIQVGKGHYLKGMAVYKDDLPEGIDLVFNTNKSRDSVESDLDAMKPLARNPSNMDEVDPDNPFGAVIKNGGQITRTKRDGTQVVTSVMNRVNDEGDWQLWSKTLSSQMLAKQSPRLAQTQLNMTQDNKEKEYAEIMELTNPTIKRRLLLSFADDADSSAVHLKAAALSQRQGYHVLLPVGSLAENEIYAPNYQDGEEVVLIRHPHGGTFEIPKLIVNNNHPEAKALLGPARDAVGINSAVAERLSGADFDGDAVIVIPHKGEVKSTPALEGLKNFDPKAEYPGYEGMPQINTQLEMGAISNLITDMTVHNAPASELARAVRHSMVVIDAEKHGLNYRESEARNGIKDLKEKYQGRKNAGAATLLSRAGAEKRVPDRIPRRASEGGPIDPVTGKKVYTETDRVNVGKDGQERPKTNKSQRLAEVDDAYELIDGVGTPIERIYADHSNKLKDLANKARLSALDTKPLPYNPAAARAYKKEVDSLVAGLKLAEMNKPRERAAQVLAGTWIRARFRENPGMDDEVKKKIRYQAQAEARARVGADKHYIDISPSEWDAIQAGAVSPSRLNKILDNANIDVVKSLATPRVQRVVTPAKLARARAMMDSGATRAEIAAQLGIPLGTLDEALYG